MKKRILRIFSLTMIFILIASTNIFAAVNRNYEYQQDTNWCWVASAKNLVIGERPISNPPTISQTEAVIEVFGYPANKTGKLDEAQTAAEYISEGQYGYGISENTIIFSTLKSLTETLSSPAYLLLYDRGEAYGHAVIMYGASGNDTIYTFDPATSEGGEKIVSYNDLIDGTAEEYGEYEYIATMYCTAHYY